MLQTSNCQTRPGLATACQVSVLQGALKIAQGSQKGHLYTRGSLNPSAHGPALIPEHARLRFAPFRSHMKQAYRVSFGLSTVKRHIYAGRLNCEDHKLLLAFVRFIEWLALCKPKTADVSRGLLIAKSTLCKRCHLNQIFADEGHTWQVTLSVAHPCSKCLLITSLYKAWTSQTYPAVPLEECPVEPC